MPTRRKRTRRSSTTFSCGHPRTPENTRTARGRGYTWGKCRTCDNRYMRAYMRRRSRDRLVSALRDAQRELREIKAKQLP